MSKRIKVSCKESELKAPRKVVISNLLLNSGSDNFEEARTEWTVQSAIDETCDGFTGQCQLCKNTNLKHNFIIYNASTDKYLQVGTTCIVRFGLGQGEYDFESGITMLQNIADEQYLINEIQTMTRSVLLPIPEYTDLNKFYSSLKKFMSLRGINNPTMDQLREVFFGSTWREVEDPIKLDRVKAIWNKPASIATHRNAYVKPLNNPKEGTTWGYKRRRNVLHHGGSSGIYKVEDYVVGKTT